MLIVGKWVLAVFSKNQQSTLAVIANFLDTFQAEETTAKWLSFLKQNNFSELRSFPPGDGLRPFLKGFELGNIHLPALPHL